MRFEELDAIDFADGARLEFDREQERRASQQLPLVSYEYRQPFGTFAGTLPGGSSSSRASASWSSTTPTGSQWLRGRRSPPASATAAPRRWRTRNGCGRRSVSSGVSAGSWVSRRGVEAAAATIGRVRPALDSLPAQRGAIQPVIDDEAAAGGAAVADRRERCDPAVRGREARAARRGRAALRAADPEVDRHERRPRRSRPLGGVGCQRPHEPGDRPAVRRGQRVAPAWSGQLRRAADLPGQRRGELTAAVEAPGRDGGRDRARPPGRSAAPGRCSRRSPRPAFGLRCRAHGDARSGRLADGARNVSVWRWLGEPLARLAHERDGLGEDDPDRVADLRRPGRRSSPGGSGG